jgi:hypothetical protein
VALRAARAEGLELSRVVGPDGLVNDLGMPWAAMSRTRPPMSAALPVRVVCGMACQLPAAQAAVSVAEIFILVMGQIAV